MHHCSIWSIRPNLCLAGTSGALSCGHWNGYVWETVLPSFVHIFTYCRSGLVGTCFNHCSALRPSHLCVGNKSGHYKCVCVNKHFTSLHHLLYLYTANKSCLKLLFLLFLAHFCTAIGCFVNTRLFSSSVFSEHAKWLGEHVIWLIGVLFCIFYLLWYLCISTITNINGYFSHIHKVALQPKL